MSRVRVYLKPLTANNTYAADWTEITKDVLQESISTFTRALDNTEFDIGIYRVSNGRLKLRNDHGKYSQEGESETIFSYRRGGSLVKVTWDRANFDAYPNIGLLPHQIWPTDERDVFVGLIADDGMKMNLQDQSVEFIVSGRESILDRTEFPFSSTKRLEWDSVKPSPLVHYEYVSWISELGLFIATGAPEDGVATASGLVLTSPDGITWTSRTTSVALSWMGPVAYSPSLGKLVAGAPGYVVTSSDGITWTATALPTATDFFQGVAWSSTAGRFVAAVNVSSGGVYYTRFAYSSNGTAWTYVTPSLNSRMNDVIWVSKLGKFFAVGTYLGPSSGGPTDCTIATSTDGATWVNVASKYNCLKAVWAAEIELLVISGVAADAANAFERRILTSTDGVQFTAQSTPNQAGNNLLDVCWIPEWSLFVALYNNGSSDIDYLTSHDGMTWVLGSDAITGGSTWRRLAWASSLETLVAAGYQISHAMGDVPSRMAYSTGGAFAEDLIKLALNQTRITSVLTYDAAQINPSINPQIDILTEYENKSVKDVLNDLLLITNSVLIVEDDTIIVKSREADASVSMTLRGPAATSGPENIIAIDNLREGTSRMMNHVSWQDTDLSESNATIIAKYGLRKKELNIPSVYNETTRSEILAEILDEFEESKEEFEVSIPLTYEALEVGLLGKVNLDFPAITLNGRQQLGFVRTTDVEYKVIEEKIDAKKDLIKLTLRRV